MILGITPANEFFVEAALFSEVFHCDAVAAEPSRVRIYPKTAVLNALRTDPASAMSFLELVAHQIIELRQRLELMKVRSAKDRVMLYLDFNAGPDGRTIYVTEVKKQRLVQFRVDRPGLAWKRWQEAK